MVSNIWQGTKATNKMTTLNNVLGHIYVNYINSERSTLDDDCERVRLLKQIAWSVYIILFSFSDDSDFINYMSVSYWGEHSDLFYLVPTCTELNANSCLVLLVSKLL